MKISLRLLPYDNRNKGEHLWKCKNSVNCVGSLFRESDWIERTSAAENFATI